MSLSTSLEGRRASLEGRSASAGGRWWAKDALLPAGHARDVRFTVVDGRFATIEVGVAPGGALRLPGVVLPGLANAHSHVFHRALRGRTHAGPTDGRPGTFWTWRDAMYQLAARLDPESLEQLARAAYAEMALAGITTVGEFHYLHHGPDARPYEDPNVMAEALRAAARDAGVRLTLLDTCYLAGGLESGRSVPLAGVQRRFGDGSVEGWGARLAQLDEDDGFRVGAAVHSVRAVPEDQLVEVVDVRRRVLHAHVSEQPAENEGCLAAYGRTPTEVFADAGLVDDQFTAVHAVHLSDNDIALLGAARATVCACPITERDLADGIAPVRALLDAGATLSLGADQHVETDLLAEARAVEHHERLRSLRRGQLAPTTLLDAATRHDSLGWDGAGALAPGQRADLVAVRLDTPRTAGIDPAQVIMVATTADVDTVVNQGRVVVESGQHRLGDVGRLLAEAIEPLWAAP